LAVGPGSMLFGRHPAGRVPPAPPTSPTVPGPPPAGPRWRKPMHIRRLPWLALLALVALPAPALAQEKPEPPALVVRVRSLENLFQSGKLLSEAAGKGEVLKQIEDLIKSKAGPKGLAALDARRPLGLYARVGKDLSDLHAVLLVPVADEKGFLELLDALNF